MSSPEEDSQIGSHPLMEEEHCREVADIKFLAGLFVKRLERADAVGAVQRATNGSEVRAGLFESS